jgi:hypothetical protein
VKAEDAVFVSGSIDAKTRCSETFFLCEVYALLSASFMKMLPQLRSDFAAATTFFPIDFGAVILIL